VILLHASTLADFQPLVKSMLHNSHSVGPHALARNRDQALNPRKGPNPGGG
jgi:hypothetical protein